VAQNEQLSPPARVHSEKDWLEIKKQYAENLVHIWEQYAPNMTWDNIIGVDTNSPYDHIRMKNLAPDGTMAGIDRSPFQIFENRPTPELGRMQRVLQLLQDHCHRHGAGQTLGGTGQGGARFTGAGAVENEEKSTSGGSAQLLLSLTTGGALAPNSIIVE
jgi:hypothetical protein